MFFGIEHSSYEYAYVKEILQSINIHTFASFEILSGGNLYEDKYGYGM